MTIHKSERPPLLFLLVGLGLAILAYAPHFRLGFLSEDFAFVRPLATLSLFADSVAWGRLALGYHLTNVLLHAANGFLVAWLYQRLRRLISPAKPLECSDDNRGGLLAMALFMLLPVQSEAVAWISSRPDLLASTMGLACLIAFTGFVATGRALSLGAALTFLALACLSKECAYGLFLALPLLAWRYGSRKILVAGGLGVISVLGGILAYRCAITVGTASFLGGDRGILVSTMLIPLRLVRMILKCAVPLNMDTLRDPLGTMPIAAIIVAASLFATAWWATRWMPVVSRGRNLGLLAMGLGCLIALPGALLPLSLADTQGDRYVYFPAALISMALATLVTNIAWRRWTPIVPLTLAVYGYFLERNLANWTRASEIALHALSYDWSDQVKGDSLVLHAIDNYNGAYIWRNGLSSALEMFCGLPSNQVVSVRNFQQGLAPAAVDEPAIKLPQAMSRLVTDPSGDVALKGRMGTDEIRLRVFLVGIDGAEEVSKEYRQAEHGPLAAISKLAMH